MTSLVSLRAALNKATPQEVTRAVRDTHGHAFVDAEAALIVAAVNALPALLNIAQAAQTFLNASYSAQNAPFDAVSIVLARRAASDGTARRVRELAGLSLDEMARFVHVSPQTILRWELGRRAPRAEAAQRYADGLRLLIATIGDLERDDAVADLQRSLTSLTAVEAGPLVERRLTLREALAALDKEQT